MVAVQQEVEQGVSGSPSTAASALQRRRGLEEQHARAGRNRAPLAADAARRAAAEPVAQLQRRHGQAVVLPPGRFRIEGLPALGGQERVLGGDEGLAAVEGVEPAPAQPGPLAGDDPVDAAAAAEHLVARPQRLDRPLLAVGHQHQGAGDEAGGFLRLRPSAAPGRAEGRKLDRAWRRAAR